MCRHLCLSRLVTSLLKTYTECGKLKLMTGDDFGKHHLIAILRHTLECGATLISFMVIGWLVKRAVPDPILAARIGFIEDFVVVSVFVVFGLHIVINLIAGLFKNAKSHFVFIA